MSYNAMLRARQRKTWATRIENYDRTMNSKNGEKYQGWEVGSSQASSIGIPAHLVRRIGARTTPIKITNGVVTDDRNLVVQQNTLGGVGRYRSQFNVDADGITPERYYLNEQLQPEPAAYKPANRTELENAIDDWMADPAAALLTYGDINTWDVTNITDMSKLFSDQVVPSRNSFNSDISNWDTSNVENMAQMFRNNYLFDQDIGDWVTSNVENMSEMFFTAHVFNQDISDWDVSNVENMYRMFSGETTFYVNAFNQNLSKWNVSNVTNFKGMFSWSEMAAGAGQDWTGESNIIVWRDTLDNVYTHISTTNTEEFFSSEHNYTPMATNCCPKIN